MSVTPDFIGQRYKDTNTGNIWIANSTTPGDWTLELQNMQESWNPTTFKLGQCLGIWIESDTITSINFLGSSNRLDLSIGPCANLTSIVSNTIQSFSGGSYSAMYIAGCPDLTEIRFPACTIVQDGVVITDNDSLATVDFGDLTTSYEVRIYDNSIISSIDLSSLVSTDADLEINGASGITSLNLASLVTVSGDIGILFCSSLQTISLPNWLPENGSQISFNGNALNLASVDGILARGVANPAFVSGNIFINGGTNAAPTLGAGSAHDILVARGVSITHN